MDSEEFGLSSVFCSIDYHSLFQLVPKLCQPFQDIWKVSQLVWPLKGLATAYALGQSPLLDLQGRNAVKKQQTILFAADEVILISEALRISKA